MSQEGLNYIKMEWKTLQTTKDSAVQQTQELIHRINRICEINSDQRPQHENVLCQNTTKNYRWRATARCLEKPTFLGKR